MYSMVSVSRKIRYEQPQLFDKQGLPFMHEAYYQVIERLKNKRPT